MQSLKNWAYSLLRRSEKVFKTDMVYLANGGFWTTASFAVGTLGSIATMIAFGNLLPKEAYGTYSYLLSLGASLSFLTLSGTGAAVLRSIARGYENVVPVALHMQLRFNLISVGIILTAALYYYLQDNSLFALSLALLAFAIPISEAFHLYKQILTAKKKFDTMTKITLITTLLGSGTTVVALLVTNNVAILIGIFALISIIPGIIAYRFSTKHLDSSAPLPDQIFEMKRTSFHITGAGVIGIIASYIDKILLFQLAGPATLAIYSFAMAGPERLKSLIKNWANIATPQLAQRSMEDIRMMIYKRIALTIGVGSLLALLYFFAAPYLFGLFLPQYLDSIRYSQLLSLSLIVVPATIYIGTIFTSQNMLKATYMLSIGSQIARIALFVSLSWFWGIWGLVVASLISNLFNAFYGVIIWETEYRRLRSKNA